ncbi:MAG TPA: GNAT family protein [Microlunatus sp.]|nr:GNAT family protein [Microlunatus sp.]
MISTTVPSPTPGWHEPLQLQGFGLTLTPLQVDDAADFLAALGPPAEASEVLAHLTYYPPADLDEATKIIAGALADPRRIPYAQRLTADRELVGTTSYYDIDETLRTLAIGHTWVARRHWRTSVNTASKLIMMGHAFDDLGAERVVWHTDIRNTRSQAAIARLGAVREGVLRHHRIRRDGSWRDTVQFSMLSAEWPEARRRLVSRLESRSDQAL